MLRVSYRRGRSSAREKDEGTHKLGEPACKEKAVVAPALPRRRARNGDAWRLRRVLLVHVLLHAEQVPVPMSRPCGAKEKAIVKVWSGTWSGRSRGTHSRGS